VAEELLYSGHGGLTALDLHRGRGSTARHPLGACGAVHPGGSHHQGRRRGWSFTALRDRFGLIQRLEFYWSRDLQAIVERAAGLLNLELDAEAPPRVARRLPLARRVSPIACCRGARCGQLCAANPAFGPRLGGGSRFTCIGSTTRGLDCQRPAPAGAAAHGLYGGGPVGLDTWLPGLARIRSPWETVVEPYCATGLSCCAFPRGRVATRRRASISAGREAA